MKYFVKEIVAIVGGFFITFLFISPMVSDNSFENNGLMIFCVLLTFFYCSGLIYTLFIKLAEAREEYIKKREAKEKLESIIANTVLVQNPDPYDISVGFVSNQHNDVV